MRIGFGLFLYMVAVSSFVCLTEGCGDVVTPYDAETLVIGEMSDAGDDKLSVATCPTGTVVARCSCSSNQCDGTEVDGQDCIAVNRHLNSGIQAVAVCKQGSSSDYEFVTQSGGTRPVATCSAGFEVIACGVRNPWSHMYCCYPEISGNGSSCGLTDDSSTRGGCRTNAVCQRISG